MVEAPAAPEVDRAIGQSADEGEAGVPDTARGRRMAFGAKRRTVLGALVVGPAALALSASTASSEARLSHLLRRLVARDLATAWALGRAHLAASPDPAALHARFQALVAAGPRDLAELRDLVGAATAEDLERGEVALVDGWVLARTEAEMLALAALAWRVPRSST